MMCNFDYNIIHKTIVTIKFSGNLDLRSGLAGPDPESGQLKRHQLYIGFYL